MKEKRYNICFAILLLILGIVILGEAFKLYNLSDLFAGWWTIFIILWGVLGVGFKKSKYSYIFIIGFGIALLLSKQRVITNNQMLLLLFSLFVILLSISILCLIFSKKVKNVVNSEINSFYSAFLGSAYNLFSHRCGLYFRGDSPQEYWKTSSQPSCCCPRNKRSRQKPPHRPAPPSQSKSPEVRSGAVLRRGRGCSASPRTIAGSAAPDSG